MTTARDEQTQEVSVIYNVDEKILSDTNKIKTNMGNLVVVLQEFFRSYSDIKKLTLYSGQIEEADHDPEHYIFWLVAYNYYWKSGMASKALTRMASSGLTTQTNLHCLKILHFGVFQVLVKLFYNYK